MGKREEERKQLEKISECQGAVILIVEDEPAVLQTTVLALERKGCKTIIATNGAEAVSTYERDKDVINLVLLDMMMPVMDGDKAIKAIREINPKAKIVMVSGFDETEYEKSIMGAHAFLQKPYTVDTLMETILEVLAI